MLLRSFGLSGFRCYSDVPAIPLHRLTVFIGENDSGKTGILDALELLLTAKTPAPGDYHRDGEIPGDRIELRGEFALEDGDTLPDDLRADGGMKLRLTKRFTATRTETVVEGRRFVDARWQTFARENAGSQRELLESVGLAPGANTEARLAQFRDALERGLIPKVSGEVPVSFGDLEQHLSRYEKVASTEYRNPDVMVQRTLRAVVENVLEPTDQETGEREPIAEVVELQARVRAALCAKVEEMQAILRRHNPDIVGASAEPSFEFSRGVTATNLTIDTGNGPQLMTSFGEGMKKKLWMALLDWEEATRTEMPNTAVFRVYDEPDVNLDYSAERRLFKSIAAMVADPSRTQAVICTHSLTLVDRAPARSINLIEVAADSKRTIRYLRGNLDDDVDDFLGEVGHSLGISNSALFYERAFLLVEGPSEENALPILYRNLYRRSLREDGIVLVNLGSCGAWEAVLGVFGANREGTTVILLDSDCQSPRSSGHITPERLANVGFSAEFARTNCFLVGQKEFEDAFSTADLLAVIEANWPKEGRIPWTPQEVDVFRAPGTKFSDALLREMRQSCELGLRNSARKPEFARQMAIHCKNANQIPERIRAAFERLREVSGAHPG